MTSKKPKKKPITPTKPSKKKKGPNEGVAGLPPVYYNPGKDPAGGWDPGPVKNY